MDYYQIGQNIRRFRKKQGLTQEQLAEKINISVPHMSHIETGNTKLSLPVLVDLSAALQVSTDDLLLEEVAVSRTTKYGGILSVLEQCSDVELKILTDVVINTKLTLSKYLTPVVR